MIGKAWWLTIYCLNFYYFTQAAFRATPILGMGHNYSQDLWFFIAAMFGRVVYSEIRKATKETQ